LFGRLRFVPAATNSAKFTIPFSTSSLDAIEAHVELKSLGVVSVEHVEGWGSAGEAYAEDALSKAAQRACSSFMLEK
jgi:hypothetical protein